MSINRKVRNLLRQMGYELSRFNPAANPVARKRRLLQTFAIDVILDVGANTGQFAQQLREDLGFAGRIISFEPLSLAFQVLRENSRRDSKWDVRNCALGDKEEEHAINIAGNSYSSSMLDMLPAHLVAAPESCYVSSEKIVIHTLDGLLDQLCSPADSIFLKIDTQGYESKVLRGAENSLARIATIQLEMSLLPMYSGEAPFAELHSLLGKKGYSLVSVEPAFVDGVTGQVLQVDGLYHRY